MVIGGNSDSGGPDLGGADDLGGTDGKADPAGADEGEAAGQACGSDGSVRAVEGDGSGWVRGAKGRRTWNRKPHVAQT